MDLSSFNYVLSLSNIYNQQGKGSEVKHSLPSTGMAANAADEFIEAVEIDDKPEAIDATTVFDYGDVDYGTKSSYIPPAPPPVTQNTYKQVNLNLCSWLKIQFG